MNLGGEPERDDFGLPPVDMEIPDDARELDRDVQAYYREQRALRRHLRHRRWGSPMARDGMVLPLLAACLVLALIAGTLLTVFTAGPSGDLSAVPSGTGAPGQRAPAGPAAAGPATKSSATSGGRTAARAPATAVTAVTGRGSRLPDTTIRTGAGQLGLRKLTASVLALASSGCDCAAAAHRLISQARQARVPMYLVGTGRGTPAVRKLAAEAGQPARLVADDAGNVLGMYRGPGLTAVLVRADGAVSLARKLGPGLQLTSELRQLAGAAAPAP